MSKICCVNLIYIFYTLSVICLLSVLYHFPIVYMCLKNNSILLCALHTLHRIDIYDIRFWWVLYMRKYLFTHMWVCQYISHKFQRWLSLSECFYKSATIYNYIYKWIAFYQEADRHTSELIAGALYNEIIPILQDINQYKHTKFSMKWYAINIQWNTHSWQGAPMYDNWLPLSQF